jgi:hypothetical protein
VLKPDEESLDLFLYIDLEVVYSRTCNHDSLAAGKLAAGSCLITPEKNPARFVSFKEISAASTFCSNLLTTKIIQCVNCYNKI